MDTSFQANSFQTDAFQIGTPAPVVGIDDDGVRRRKDRDLEDELRRLDDEFWFLLD